MFKIGCDAWAMYNYVWQPYQMWVYLVSFQLTQT